MFFVYRLNFMCRRVALYDTVSLVVNGNFIFPSSLNSRACLCNDFELLFHIFLHNYTCFFKCALRRKHVYAKKENTRKSRPTPNNNVGINLTNTHHLNINNITIACHQGEIIHGVYNGWWHIILILTLQLSFVKHNR